MNFLKFLGVCVLIGVIAVVERKLKLKADRMLKLRIKI